MKVAHSIPADKTERLVDLAIELQEFVDQAAADGESLYETEKGVLAKVLKMGHLAIDRFLQRQGDGDCGWQQGEPRRDGTETDLRRALSGAGDNRVPPGR